MKSLGCIDAVNFDGGGSSLLYANKYVTNNPSDGTPRPVVTALLIYKKNSIE